MYDKRYAWILAGLASQCGNANSLLDIMVAAMTEIPTTKQWRSDKLSAVHGCGIIALALNTHNSFESHSLKLKPSKAYDVKHAFGTVSRFFPEGLELLGAFEERL